MSLRRPALVFSFAVLVLGLLAGRELWQPSRDNHFALMAQGWLDGRTSLAGAPPHRNDFARVTTLELADGRTFRAIACQTRACRRLHARGQGRAWRALDGDTIIVKPSEVLARRETWYVTFPPGPAVFLLPWVAVFGTAVLDVVLTVLVGAAFPACLVAWLDRVRGTHHGHAREHLWAALAWTLASPACFVASHGNVWFTAQTLASLCILGFIIASWNLRAPALAGLALVAAVSCRPTLLLAGSFFAWQWWHGGRSARALVRFCVPLLLGGLVLGWFNWLRFDNPFVFGHEYLDIAWQPRIQEHGLFAWRYVARNLHCMLLLLPKYVDGWPPFRVSIHGLSLLVSTPWLWMGWIGLLQHRRAALRVGDGSEGLGQAGDAVASAEPRVFDARVRVLWLCALFVLFPALFYQNSGQLQFTYRFALDGLPFVVVAMTLAGTAATRWFHLGVVIGMAIQLHGAYWFTRAPDLLFVRSHWPYTP